MKHVSTKIEISLIKIAENKMFDGKGGEHLIQNGQSNGGDFDFNGRKWELFSILNDEIPVRKRVVVNHIVDRL